MILILCVILLIIIYILDMKINQQIKKKKEKFKNKQSFEPKYLNDPIKLEKYKYNKINKNKLNNNAFMNPNSIQTNQFGKISNNSQLSKLKIYPNRLKHQIKTEIFDPELEQIFNKIESTKSYQNQPNTNPNSKNKISVTFNPIVHNPETKYKLYHESLFRTKPAEKLIDSKIPLIDQTISQNIMAYMNQGIESVYQNSLDINQIDFNQNQTNFNQNPNLNLNQNQTNPTNIKKTKGRTIKEIYDDITNDGRQTLQQNLDDLEATDKGTQFIIGEKYGATRFDTYSIR